MSAVTLNALDVSFCIFVIVFFAFKRPDIKMSSCYLLVTGAFIRYVFYTLPDFIERGPTFCEGFWGACLSCIKV